MTTTSSSLFSRRAVADAPCRVLYRYRPFNSERLSPEVSHSRIFLWRLDDQNDPFEGQFRLTPPRSDDEIASFFTSFRARFETAGGAIPSELANRIGRLFGDDRQTAADTLRSFLSADVSERSRLIRRAVERFQDPAYLALIRGKLLDMCSKTVIGCFSEVSDHALMWAHYARGHTGVCLGYAIDLRDLFPVTYCEDVPELSCTNLDADAVVKARLLTKGLPWEYEREVRLVLYPREPGWYENPRIRLAEIYIGARASPEVEAWAIERATELQEVSVFRVIPKNSKYELIPEAVSRRP